MIYFCRNISKKTLIYLKIYHHMNNTTLAGHAGVVFTF